MNRCLSLLCLSFALISGAALAEPLPDRTTLVAGSPSVDVGMQPLGVPSGVISAVMRRDRLLQHALKEKGGVTFYAFSSGAEILPHLADHRLEAALLGDMPTLIATVREQAAIVGLVKQTSTAIVGRGILSVGELAGKRIAYVDTSSAHHTLLQGLRSAGLTDQQVKLVAMPVAEMADALARGEIDAFAAWEPVPSAALAADPRSRVIFRGLTNDFFVLNRTLVDKRPADALQLVAAFVRAIEWMRRSPANLERAVRWVKADAQAHSGKTFTVSDPQIARITRQDILDVAAAPVIPGRLTSPPLRGEFDFLVKQGKLPADAHWASVSKAFEYDGLATVMADRRRYQLSTFDYAD